jgi:endonuclease/exonuclease/phosphatase family metal-dependent hydrolase
MKANEKNKGLGLFLKLMLLLNVLNSVALIAAYLATHISPNTFIYFSFFGLTFPVWLTVEVVFIVFWLMFRRRFILISLITLMIGFNHVRNFITFNFLDEDITAPLKVLSYNVKIFNLYDTENRVALRDANFQFLKEEDAGVYCFQEFYHQDASGSNEFVTKDNLVKLLNTPFHHERYTHEMSNKRYFGVATFSKHPIINKGEIGFDNDDNNFCIYSDIVIEQDTFRVFNGHLGSIRFQNDDYKFFGDELDKDKYVNEEAGQRIVKLLSNAFKKRATQAEVVAKYIAASPYPTIFCGDINDTPVSYAYTQFTNQLSDAFVNAGNGIGQTYIGKIPSNRIDYILYGPELKAKNFITHAVNFSDHKPITCEIGK